MRSDEDEDVGIVWTSSASRGRFYNSNLNERLKLISTDPMKRGAGETETERDEPPRHLPTSRKPPLRVSTPPLAPIPILFQIFRLLSVVPATAGTLYHVYALITSNSGSGSSPHSLIDHLICALLTAHQCLCLTTGLLLRWKAYYPPLPTLIRLLALQAICWPATQFTLVLLDHAKRPVVCWAAIGSTTCVSRAVQIWVTSNLWGGGGVGGGLFGGWGEEGRKWGPRRWDWTEVGVRCALPAGVVYFVMAWGMVLEREFGGC
ncbi:hypothetical protein BU17DRAFT_35541 [Hysterangium stoloniferum]|nr:hypothetical protein BU17DRAFT_35541 [Hysterangium stoloniferum]